MRKMSPPRTKLDQFLSNAPFSAGKLARAADMPVQHLVELRAGRSEPKFSTMQRLIRAASHLLGRSVGIHELFGIGDTADK